MTDLHKIAEAVYLEDMRRMDEAAKVRADLHGYTAPTLEVPRFSTIGAVSTETYLRRAAAALDVIAAPSDALIEEVYQRNFRRTCNTPDKAKDLLRALLRDTAAVIKGGK